MKNNWMEKSIKFLSNKAWLFILLLGLIPLTWFRKGLLIAGGDEYGLLNPGSLTGILHYAWNIKLTNAGGVILSMPKLVPMMYFWTLFESLGWSLQAIEKLWAVLLFLLPGLSIYYLMSKLEGRTGAKLAAAVLYMFNLFIVVAGPFQTNIKPLLIALPLMLAFWIEGLKKEKESLKYAILIGFSSLIYAGTNVNPPAVAIIPLVLFLYWFFELLVEKKFFRPSLKFVFTTAIFYLLFNFWWLLNFLSSIGRESSGLRGVITFNALAKSGLLDFFRLLGSWGWRSGSYKMPYFPFAFRYDQPILILLTFSLSILAIWAIFARSRDKKVAFFGFLLTIGLFMAKGAAPPLGSVYQWLWEHFPGFWVFREPFAKFTPITVLAFSVLLGFSADILFDKTKEWLEKRKSGMASFLPLFISPLIVAVVLVVSFPLLNGRAIWDYWNGSMRSFHVKVPGYWTDLKKWLDENDKEARVFLSPKGGYGVAYNWENGFSTADAPAIVLLSNPTLRSSLPISLSDQVVSLAYKFLLNPRGKSDFARLLSLLNAKYVLQQNDLDWKFADPIGYSPEVMKAILRQQKGISLLKSFGSLDLYRVDNEYLAPHLYPAYNLVFVSATHKTFKGTNNLNAFLDVMSFEGPGQAPAIYVENPLAQTPVPLDLPSSVFDEVWVRGNLENVIDEKFLEEKARAERQTVDAYVSHLPHSLTYPLVLAKEEFLEWRSNKNKAKLIELKLTHASKRVNELVKMDLTDSEETKTNLKRYLGKMKEAATLIKTVEQEDERRILELEFDFNLRSHEEKITQWLNQNKNEKLSALVGETFNQLFQEITSFGKAFDFDNLQYSFEIPENGEYEFYTDEVEPNFLAKMGININGQKLAFQSKLDEQGRWVKLGKVNLNKGQTKVILNMPQNINLITNNGWKKIGDNLYSQPIQDWGKDTFYYLAFDYKVQGQSIEVGILRDDNLTENDKKVYTVEQFFNEQFPSGASDWKSYEKIFRSNESTIAADLFFLLKPTEGKEAKIDYKNFRVLKIHQPKLIFQLVKNSSQPLIQITPQIIYQKINPTKYEIEVKGAKGPYFLVFNETFNDGWKAYLNKKGEGKGRVINSFWNEKVKEEEPANVFLGRKTFETWTQRPISEENHLLINGFANSWYITPELMQGQENYKIILEFAPQKLFYLGTFISLGVAGGSLVFLLLLLFKKNKKDK